MNKQILFASALAVLGLTSCEKELTDDIGDVGSGQVKNSLLQVRTRGSSPGSEATVAYPLQVYVFQGDECRMPGGQVPGRPAENKTAEPVTMKDELGGYFNSGNVGEALRLAPHHLVQIRRTLHVEFSFFVL